MSALTDLAQILTQDNSIRTRRIFWSDADGPFQSYSGELGKMGNIGTVGPHPHRVKPC